MNIEIFTEDVYEHMAHLGSDVEAVEDLKDCLYGKHPYEGLTNTSMVILAHDWDFYDDEEKMELAKTYASGFHLYRFILLFDYLSGKIGRENH